MGTTSGSAGSIYSGNDWNYDGSTDAFIRIILGMMGIMLVALMLPLLSLAPEDSAGNDDVDWNDPGHCAACTGTPSGLVGILGPQTLIELFI